MFIQIPIMLTLLHNVLNSTDCLQWVICNCNIRVNHICKEHAKEEKCTYYCCGFFPKILLCIMLKALVQLVLIPFITVIKQK